MQKDARTENHLGSIKIFVACAAVFFCATMPFRFFAALTSVTEVRPAVAFQAVSGLLFGFWGALGCAAGNLAADLLSGYSPSVAAASFVLQFAAGYLFYVLWYGRFSAGGGISGGRPETARRPALNKVSGVVRFCGCVCAAAVFTAVMIGFLLEISGGGGLFSVTTVIVFFNHIVFGILLGLPLVVLLTKSGARIVTPRPPKKARPAAETLRVLLSDAFLALFAAALVFCVLYRLSGRAIPASAYILENALALLGLSVKPFRPCGADGDARAGDADGLSVNERMIFSFTFSGIILTAALGLAGYIRLSELGYAGAGLWERLYVWVSCVIIFCILIAGMTLRYMEENVTVPIMTIAGALAAYDTGSSAESGALIARTCRKVAENRNEIGKMAEAVGRMIHDIEVYTADIRSGVAERERIAAELALASRIQTGIVPHNFADFLPMGAEIFAEMLPAKTVGGDFYDFFRVGERKLGIVIGDVSGKGIPAALFMAVAKMLLEMFLTEGKSAAESLSLTNRYLCGHNRVDMFVTAFAAVYDTESGVLSYSNAGHNPPLVLRGGASSFLRLKSGLVMGVTDSVVYQEEKISLGAGEALFLYTDGVTEAHGAARELFGKERLCAALSRAADQNAEAAVAAVRKAVDDFSAGAEQSDDITMLALRIRR